MGKIVKDKGFISAQMVNIYVSTKISISIDPFAQN